MDHIGVRETVQFMGLTFNWETLCMTWLAMIVTIAVSLLAVRSLKVIPTGWQNFIEIIVEWLHGQIEGMMGRRGMFLAPFIVSLFLFLLTSNLLGLIPFLESPTNDLNTTLGLALMVVFMVHFFGLYFKGGHYIAHFFQPIAPFVVINAIEEIAKPITFLLHLTENPFWLSLPSVAWLGFSIFISCVHAVIFTMLSMAYLGNAVKDSH